MMMVITALTAEVSALRDRVDTHEALAARGTFATFEAIEGYVTSEADDVRREVGRAALLKRVYRVLTEELDAINESAEASTAGTWKMPEEWDKK